MPTRLLSVLREIIVACFVGLFGFEMADSVQGVRAMTSKSASSERGAVLILVAIALFGLVAFAAIVVDNGIMMASRAQAQTAADAAALAAARSMAFDNTQNLPHFRNVGQAFGQSNAVFGQQPDIQLADITFPTCPPTPGFPAGDTCVEVHAYRNARPGGNPLPTFFASMVGVLNQGVQATATARAIAANSSNCLKPWAVADKWLDTQPGGWSQNALYDPASGDSYVPPSANNPGNGFTMKDAAGNPTFYGYQMILKYGNPGQGPGSLPINSAGWAMELALNNAASPNPQSTPAYNANITGCTSDVVAINPGTPCGTTVDPSIGCLAIKTGGTGSNNAKSVADFIAANDPGATWTNGANNDYRTGKITTSQSPSARIVPIAIFHLPEYLGAGYTGSNGIVRIVNIVGFFLEGTCATVSVKDPYLTCPGGGSDKDAIVGRLVSYPALAAPTGGTVAGAWGYFIILVR
jgi:hypothetical protein